jgi:hypothetical protein
MLFTPRAGGIALDRNRNINLSRDRRPLARKAEAMTNRPEPRGLETPGGHPGIAGGVAVRKARHPILPPHQPAFQWKAPLPKACCLSNPKPLADGRFPMSGWRPLQGTEPSPRRLLHGMVALTPRCAGAQRPSLVVRQAHHERARAAWVGANRGRTGVWFEAPDPQAGREHLTTRFSPYPGSIRAKLSTLRCAQARRPSLVVRLAHHEGARAASLQGWFAPSWSVVRGSRRASTPFAPHHAVLETLESDPCKSLLGETIPSAAPSSRGDTCLLTDIGPSQLWPDGISYQGMNFPPLRGLPPPSTRVGQGMDSIRARGMPAWARAGGDRGGF